jgi:hypothetical protein
MVVPVKFESGLSITFLRKKQLFTKKGGQKFTISKKGPIFEKTTAPPENSPSSIPSLGNCNFSLIMVEITKYMPVIMRR